MQSYQHHIGDFDKATRHLNRIERGVYRDLMDVYYDTEKPLTADIDRLKRKILATSETDSKAVDFVLQEFFLLTPEGFFNARCDQEILQYQSNTSQKALAGRASANAKALRKQQALNGCLTGVELPLKSVATKFNVTSQPITINQEPITNNHKPIKEKSAKAPPYPKPDDVELQVWQDWKELRAKKRATVTDTVVKGARGQAQIAGMSLNDFLAVWCRRGSQGLEAAWLKPEERRALQNRHSAGAAAIFEGASHV